MLPVLVPIFHSAADTLAQANLRRRTMHSGSRERRRQEREKNDEILVNRLNFLRRHSLFRELLRVLLQLVLGCRRTTSVTSHMSSRQRRQLRQQLRNLVPSENC